MIIKIVQWITSDGQTFGSEFDALKHCEIKFHRGDRVLVNQTAGFNKGATAEVKYVEPNETRVWVRRDGSSFDVFYQSSELDLIDQ